MSVDGKVWLWKILGGCGVMLLQIDVLKTSR